VRREVWSATTKCCPDEEGELPVNDTTQYGLLLFLVAAAGLCVLLAHRLTAIIRVPAPALMLIATAVTVRVAEPLTAPDPHTVERVVTVALIYILFDGGLHLGWSRIRPSLLPVISLGTLGTLLCVAGAAAFLTVTTDLSWYQATLLGTAVAPTDPAVVFSVFGNREVRGHGGTVLEGESGANDPVGIALMVSLVTAGGLSLGTIGTTAREFLLQMAVGAVVGIVGAALTGLFFRRVALFNEALYPLRSAACALAIFGLATWAHGSGFLAVFLAGICLGDLRVPRRREIREFHGALASLGEIVAFVVLGLTVDLHVLGRLDVWLPGVLLAAAMTFLIRPGLGTPCLVGSNLDRRERIFVLFAGLKGAVPILLGLLLLEHHIPDAERLYGIVVVVVVFSVVVQGSAIPLVARLLRIPLRTVQMRPHQAEY
jgi:potassium/hydrogen antiporter